MPSPEMNNRLFALLDLAGVAEATIRLLQAAEILDFETLALFTVEGLTENEVGIQTAEAELVLAAASLRSDCPDFAQDPISLDLICDPVLAADGYTYDRASIARWMTTNATSPLTQKKLSSKRLTTDESLRGRIRSVAVQRACDAARLRDPEFQAASSIQRSWRYKHAQRRRRKALFVATRQFLCCLPRTKEREELVFELTRALPIRFSILLDAPVTTVQAHYRGRDARRRLSDASLSSAVSKLQLAWRASRSTARRASSTTSRHRTKASPAGYSSPEKKGGRQFQPNGHSTNGHLDAFAPEFRPLNNDTNYRRGRSNSSSTTCASPSSSSAGSSHYGPPPMVPMLYPPVLTPNSPPIFFAPAPPIPQFGPPGGEMYHHRQYTPEEIHHQQQQHHYQQQQQQQYHQQQQHHYHQQQQHHHHQNGGYTYYPQHHQYGYTHHNHMANNNGAAQHHQHHPQQHPYYY